MNPKRTRNVTVITSISLLSMLAMFSVTGSVLAGPVNTTTPVKTYIYDGVATVSVTGTTSNTLPVATRNISVSSILEIGAYGTDIAGTNVIYFQPGAVGGENPPRMADIRASSGVSTLEVGSICLYGSGSENCQYSWPSSGTGDTFWNIESSGPPYYVTPNNTGRGVMIGGSATITNTAIEVYGNRAGTPAALFNGTVVAGQQHISTTEYNEDYQPIRTFSGTGNVKITAPGGTGAVRLTASTDNVASTSGIYTNLDPTKFYYNGVFYNYGTGTWIPHIPIDVSYSDESPYADKQFVIYPWTTNNFRANLNVSGLTPGHFQTPSTLDVDTIDAATSSIPAITPPINLFWYRWEQSISGTTYYRQSLCFNSDKAFLCTTGSKVGQVCTAASASSAECNGGVCRAMCTTVARTCAASPAQPAVCAGSQRCDGNPLYGCQVDSDCNVIVSSGVGNSQAIYVGPCGHGANHDTWSAYYGTPAIDPIISCTSATQTTDCYSSSGYYAGSLGPCVRDRLITISSYWGQQAATCTNTCRSRAKCTGTTSAQCSGVSATNINYSSGTIRGTCTDVSGFAVCDCDCALDTNQSYYDANTGQGRICTRDFAGYTSF